MASCQLNVYIVYVLTKFSENVAKVQSVYAPTLVRCSFKYFHLFGVTSTDITVVINASCAMRKTCQ